MQWIYEIYRTTGINVNFPIISDKNGAIAREYGMISPEVSNVEAVRNVFIIDTEGKIRSILMYPMEVSRCVSEIIRIIQTLQANSQRSKITPVVTS